MRISISASLLTVLAFQLDFKVVATLIRITRWDYWFAALGLYVTAQFVSSWRWQLLATPLGFRGGLGRFTAFYAIGMFFNMMLPSSVGGDVIRAMYLDNRPGKRLNALLSVLADRGSGLLVLLGVACVAMMSCPIALPAWIPLGVWGTAVGAIACLALLPLFHRWASRFERTRRLTASIAVYRHYPGLLFGTALLSVFVQAANVVIVWLIGLAINLPIPGFFYWIFVPMVTLLTLVPISLNGMGIREASIVLFLQSINIGHEAAIFLSMLWFLVFVAASLMGGAVYLLGKLPKLEVQTDHEAIRCDPCQGRKGESPTAA